MEQNVQEIYGIIVNNHLELFTLNDLISNISRNSPISSISINTQTIPRNNLINIVNQLNISFDNNLSNLELTNLIYHRLSKIGHILDNGRIDEVYNQINTGFLGGEITPLIQQSSQVLQPAWLLPIPIPTRLQSISVQVPLIPIELSPILMPTQLPSIPTQLPSIPTQLPSMPIQLPSMPIKLPSMPIQLPSMPIQLPSMPTQLPSIPTQLPSIQIPTQQSQIPQIPQISLQQPRIPQIQIPSVSVPTQQSQIPQIPQISLQQPRIPQIQIPSVSVPTQQSPLQDIYFFVRHVDLFVLPGINNNLFYIPRRTIMENSRLVGISDLTAGEAINIANILGIEHQESLLGNFINQMTTQRLIGNIIRRLERDNRIIEYNGQLTSIETTEQLIRQHIISRLNTQSNILGTNRQNINKIILPGTGREININFKNKY